MLISLGLGQSPAVSAGDIPLPPAGQPADAGLVPAFGDQVRQLLGAWATAPAAEGPLASVPAPETVRTAGAPSRDRGALAEEGGAVADDRDAPPVAAPPTIVDLALWMDAMARQAPAARALPDPETVAAPAGSLAVGHGQPAPVHPARLPFSAEAVWADGFAAGYLAAQPGAESPEESQSAVEAPRQEPAASALVWTATAAGPEFQKRADGAGPDRDFQPAAHPNPSAPDAFTAMAGRGQEQSHGIVDARSRLRLIHPRSAEGAPTPRASSEVVASPAGGARSVEPGTASLAPAAPPDAPPASAVVRLTEPGHVDGPQRPVRGGSREPAPVEPVKSHARLSPPPTEGRAAWHASSLAVTHDVEAPQSSPRRATEASQLSHPYLTLVESTRQASIASAGSEVRAAAPQESSEPELPEQIVQSLRLQATAGGGEARVQLRPEYLGELTIRVVVEDGAVTARLEAEAPAVREWIERHEVSLRQALGEHGLTLDELSVSDRGGSGGALDEGERDDTAERESPQHHRRARRRADDDEPRFEVTA
ncbi:MAG: flagellar hook-length control protein FliK [Vicinamibacterales bacterium]